MENETGVAYPITENRQLDCFEVKVSKLLICPEGEKFSLEINPPAAFHKMRRVPTLSHKV